MSTEHEFMQRMVVFAPNGSVDMKKTQKNFEEVVSTWVKAQAEIKPTILAELAAFGRLGELDLIRYTLAQLRIAPTGDNQERVKGAIKELESQNKIVYQVNEQGLKKGRNVGYTLPEYKQQHTTTTT